MTEVVSSTRELLHGEEVSRDDRYVHLDAVRMDQPPEHPPPLLIGTTGERGIATAGAVADGLVLPEGTGAAAVSWASGLMASAGAVVVYAWTRVEDDGSRARAVLLPTVQAWRDGGMYPNLVAAAEVGKTVDEAAVRRVALAGTPRECADGVLELGAAGADSVVLAPAGDDPAAQLDRIADAVLPLVR